MSKKWQRNKAWEDANLTGAWTPFRLVLRAFSSIPLAVVLLLFVSLYATLASIPVGLLARIPTLVIVSALYLILLGVPVLVWLFIARKTMGDQSRALRFFVSFMVVIAMGVGVSLLWRSAIWPSLKYHTSDGSGFMLFRSIVEEYKSTTVRRLPMLEMTELEFYAWWPMRLALILFVINMIVATVRRIEFNFKNLGVLSVHTGIVVIALGSIFYQRFKVEGDTLLPAGTDTLPGPSQRAFYDREDVALYVAQARTPNAQPRFEMRALDELPLYNAYSLNAGIPDGVTTLSDIIERELEETDKGRTLNLEVPSNPNAGDGTRRSRHPVPRRGVRAVREARHRVVRVNPIGGANAQPVSSRGSALQPRRRSGHCRGLQAVRELQCLYRRSGGTHPIQRCDRA